MLKVPISEVELLCINIFEPDVVIPDGMVHDTQVIVKIEL